MAFRGSHAIDHNRDDDDDGFYKSKRNTAIADKMGNAKAGDRRHKKAVPGGHNEPGSDEDDYPSIGKTNGKSTAATGSEDSGGTTFEDEEGQSAGYTPDPTSQMPEDVEPKRPLRLTDRNKDRDVTQNEEGPSGLASKTKLGNVKKAMKGTGGHAQAPLGGKERYNQLRDSSSGDSPSTEGLPKSSRPTQGTAGPEGLPRGRPNQEGTKTSGSNDGGSFLPEIGRNNPPAPRTHTALGNNRNAMEGTGGHAKPPLGSGGRFAQLKSKLAHKPGVTNPAALAASIGRKKYGGAKMAKMAAHNR